MFRASRVLDPTAAGAGAGKAKATLAMKRTARLVNCIVKIVVCFNKEIGNLELRALLGIRRLMKMLLRFYQQRGIGGVLIAFEMRYFHEFQLSVLCEGIPSSF